MIAHRGASARAPENTLPAFELAVDGRADMIETDLHQTRDGAIVLVHDAELERLGGRGVIGDAGLAEVRALDAGEGARVPTLDEALDRFGHRVAFNLEIKRGPRGPYPGLEAAVLDAVRRRGLLSRMLFSCFEDSVLERLRALEPGARLAVLASPRSPGRGLARARAVAAEAVHPWFGTLRRAQVEAAHAAGLAVHPYTVDDPQDMGRLLDWGVDGLFTNRPERLRAIVDGRSGPPAAE